MSHITAVAAQQHHQPCNVCGRTCSCAPGGSGDDDNNNKTKLKLKSKPRDPTLLFKANLRHRPYPGEKVTTTITTTTATSITDNATTQDMHWLIIKEPDLSSNYYIVNEKFWLSFQPDKVPQDDAIRTIVRDMILDGTCTRPMDIKISEVLADLKKCFENVECHVAIEHYRTDFYRIHFVPEDFVLVRRNLNRDDGSHGLIPRIKTFDVLSSASHQS